MKKLLALAALMLAIPCLSQPASASTLIKVSQESAPGASDFDSNPIGFIKAFKTARTAANYYQYSLGAGSSFNGAIEQLSAENSHLFFVQAADGLSLFLVHNRPNSEVGGNARMLFDLLNDTAELKVVDDPGEAEGNAEGTVFTTNFGWGPCCTDGLVIGSLDGNWEMQTQFTADPRGVNHWYALSGEKTSSIPLSMETSRRVKFQTLVVATPEPSLVIPLAVVGLALTQRRRRHSNNIF